MTPPLPLVGNSGVPMEAILVPVLLGYTPAPEELKNQGDNPLTQYIPIEDQFIDHFQEDVGIIADSPTLWILMPSAGLGAYVIGANDFGNAMGTTVGAAILSLPNARLVAAPAALLGSLYGGKTAKTIKSGIWDATQTSLDTNEIQIGQAVALYAAGAVILIATKGGYPISTTQATAGSIAGIGTVAEMTKLNDYNAFGKGVKWGTVPSIDTEKLGFSYLKGHDGENHLKLEGVDFGSGFVKMGSSWVASVVLGFSAGYVSSRLLGPAYKATQFNPIANFLWTRGPIVSGAAVSFSLGRNDVPHASGIAAAGIDSAKSGEIGSSAGVNQWLGVAGGILLVLGMRQMGGQVTHSLGTKFGHLNPAKALAAELSCAGVVNIFNVFGVPVSTSQTIVAAVMGAIAGSGGTTNWLYFRKVGAAWVLAPASGLAVSALAYGGYLAVATTDRDAPAIEDHGASTEESLGQLLVRLDRAAQSEGVIGSRIPKVGKAAKYLPLGTAGVILSEAAIVHAAEEGPRPLFAQISKFGVETIPVIGPAAQIADGAYVYWGSYDRSWWGNLQTTRNEASGDIYLGLLQLGLDLTGVAGLASRLSKARKVVSITEEGAEVAAKALARDEVDPSKLSTGRRMLRSLFGRSKGGVGIQRRELQVTLASKHVTEIMREALETAAKTGKWGKVRRVLLRDSAETALLNRHNALIRQLVVREHATQLYRIILHELGADAPEVAKRAIEALQSSLESAMARGRAGGMERQVLNALLEGGVDIRKAKSLIRHAGKETREGIESLVQEPTLARYLDDLARGVSPGPHSPLGDLNLATHGRPSLGPTNPLDFYHAQMLGEAVTIANRYNSPFRRYGAMTWRVAAEPFSFMLTTRGIGYAAKRVAPEGVARTMDVASAMKRGWVDNMNPFSPLLRTYRAGREYFEMSQ